MTHQPILYLLKAEQLPHSQIEIREAMTVHAQEALALVTQIKSGTSNDEVSVCVDTALETIKFEPLPTVYTRQEQALLSVDRYEEHDAFFGVVRVIGNAMSGFISSTLQAYRGLLREALNGGVTLQPYEWGYLRLAFEGIFSYLHNPSSCSLLSDPSLPDTPSTERREWNPLRRWRTGHQAFFVLIQGLIITFNCIRSGLNAQNLTDIDTALELATVLMRGSAASLRFAGDFSSAEYEQIVRPAMMPPYLEIGFSGLQARDHRYMLKLLRELKPMILQLEGTHAYRYCQFVDAIEDVYEAHKFVCARFRGDLEPSLRMNPSAKLTAVEALDQLKRNRLEMMRPRKPSCS